MASVIDLSFRRNPLAGTSLPSLRVLSVSNFVIMPPNPKAKKDLQKLTIAKDKPVVGIIEKDGPIVDSPEAIDFKERDPGGSPKDVRAFALTFPHLNVAIALTIYFGTGYPRYGTAGVQNSMREPLLQALWTRIGSLPDRRPTK